MRGAGRRRAALDIRLKIFDQTADGLAIGGAFTLVGPVVEGVLHHQRQALAFLDMRLQGRQAFAQQVAHLSTGRMAVIGAGEYLLAVFQAKAQAARAGDKAQALQVCAGILLVAVIRVARGPEQAEIGVVTHGLTADGGGFGQLGDTHR